MKKSKLPNILKDYLFYTTSTYINFILGFARSLVIPKLLGPEIYGIWRSLNLILPFVRIFGFGQISALRREIPFCIAKNDYANSSANKSISLTVSIISTTFLIVLIFIYFYYINPKKWANYLIAFLPVILLSQISIWGGTILSGEKRFKLLSKINVNRSIITTIFALIGTHYYGLIGCILGTTCGFFYQALYLFREIDLDHLYYFKLQRFIYLFKIGFPVTLNGVLYDFMRSIDRFFIVTFLGFEQMGIYSICIALLDLINQAGYQMVAVLSPRLIGQYGKNENVHEIRKWIEVPTLVMSLIGPIILSLAIYSFELIINVYLVKYIDAIIPFRILCIGMFFNLLRMNLSPFLMALKKLHNVLYFYTFSIIINSALAWSFIKYGMGLIGASFASTISYTILSFLVLNYSISIYTKKIKSVAILNLKLLLPPFICVCIFILLESISINTVFNNKIANEIFRFVYRSFLICTLYFPILIVGIRFLKKEIYEKKNIKTQNLI